MARLPVGEGVRCGTSDAAGPVQVALWAGVSGVVDLLEEAARDIRCRWPCGRGIGVVDLLEDGYIY